MKLLEVALRDIIEAPRAHRVREVDEAFVQALAESFRAGSDQQSPIPVYEAKGKYHALGGNHQLAAMKAAFGADSDKGVYVRILVPRKQEDAILEAAKDNNHRDMTMLEWQGIFELAKSRLGTQRSVAVFFGVSESFVSHCLKGDSYGPEAQARRRSEKVVVTTESPQSYILPPPQSGGLTTAPFSSRPENPPETGVSGASASLHPDPKPALGGSQGGDGAESASMLAGRSISEPPLSSSRAPPSPLRALQEAVEALRAACRMPEWDEADEATLRAVRGVLASLDATLYDFRSALDDPALFTPNGPTPLAQVFAFKIMDEVRIRTEPALHRAWVIAHIPGGRAKLRKLVDGKKEEVIVLERDLVRVRA